MNKRFLIAGLAAAAVFASVLGLAATIAVTSDTLGAGGTTVSSCDTAVSVSYVTKFVGGASPKFVVDKVVVKGLDDSCVGKTLTVQLTGTGGSALGNPESKLLTAGDIPNATVEFPDANEQDASLVQDVHIVITG